MLAKGLAVLHHLEAATQPASTSELATRVGIDRIGVLRILRTLEAAGYVQHDQARRYAVAPRAQPPRIGYCAPLRGTPFRRVVADGLQKAAAEAGLALTVLDNPEDDAETGRQNAEFLVSLGARAAIVFQPQLRVAHGLADCLTRAGVPFISIDAPIPGGFCFGANNFQAGKLAGQALGTFARRHWRGRCDVLVLLEAHLADTAVEARCSGALVGLRDVLEPLPESRVRHVDGRGQREASRLAMRDTLAAHRPGTKMLVSCFNDPTALGAVEATRELGRTADVAIVGQNATSDVRAELADPASPLIGSAAYFAERYGTRLVELCQRLLRDERLPPAALVEHIMLTRENWRRHYPEA